jgi:hypothetical protein
MSASLLSGETGNALIALLKRDKIVAGPNIEITSRDENGTFLRRTNTAGGIDELFDQLQIQWFSEGAGAELERDIDFLGALSVDLDDAGEDQQPDIINAYVEGGDPFVVDIEKARADGLWSGSIVIGLLASWDTTSSVSESASVTVTYRGVSLSKEIFPGNESGAPSGREDAGNTPVGSIVVFDNGTFFLN